MFSLSHVRLQRRWSSNVARTSTALIHRKKAAGACVIVLRRKQRVAECRPASVLASFPLYKPSGTFSRVLRPYIPLRQDLEISFCFGSLS